MNLWLLVAVGAVLVIYVIASFNRLVTLRYRVRDAWAQIDVGGDNGPEADATEQTDSSIDDDSFGPL